MADTVESIDLGNRAERFRALALKKLKPSLWSSIFEDSKDAAGDAAELFSRAASLFKSVGKISEAIKDYSSAAKCFESVDRLFDAGKALEDVAECSQSLGLSVEANTARKQAVFHYQELGLFDRVARIYHKMASLASDKTFALEYYILAANFYGIGGRQGLPYRECREKIAELYIDMELASDGHNDISKGYLKAIEIYDTLLEGSSYALPKLGLRMVLCNLANGDIVASKRCLVKLEGFGSKWTSSKENKLTRKLIEAAENYDESLFISEIQSHDHIYPLDTLEIGLLCAAKKALGFGEDSSLIL